MLNNILELDIEIEIVAKKNHSPVEQCKMFGLMALKWHLKNAPIAFEYHIELIHMANFDRNSSTKLTL